MEYPNLAGVATAELVDTIGTGKFSAAYINWSRTMNLLRTHAPGWLPELVETKAGDILHQSPVGAYLLIRFRHGDAVTPAVPQAVMDTRNAAIPLDRITARDITDTHRRGVCMAAAFTFGLAYELWAKLPLESGYPPQDDDGRDNGDKSEAFDAKAAALEVKAGVKRGDASGAARYLAGLTQSRLDAVWAKLTKDEQDQLTAVWP
ncbi:MAG: hypothetical protein RL758_149 [Pseudomonadota bacterium]